ncbi:hypothetical protein GCM10027615_41710 [Plantactinospora veratri]
MPGEVPAQPGWAGIRTLTLRDYVLDPARRGPLLVDRHLLILVTVGHGTQEIDFRAYPCRPGSLLWVRPGQVVQHGGQSGLDAVMVCWAAETMRDLGVSPTGPPFTAGYWQLAGEDEDAVINEVSQLVVDCQRHGGGTLATELLRHQLAVLLLRLALLPRDPADPGAVPSGPARAARTPWAVPMPIPTRTVRTRPAPSGGYVTRSSARTGRPGGSRTTPAGSTAPSVP